MYDSLLEQLNQKILDIKLIWFDSTGELRLECGTRTIHRSYYNHFHCRHTHVYLCSPLDVNSGQCRCCCSVQVGSHQGHRCVRAAWSLLGCRADWEEYGSEERSDTASGTSGHRWSWCLRRAATRETEGLICFSSWDSACSLVQKTKTNIRKTTEATRCVVGLQTLCLPFRNEPWRLLTRWWHSHWCHPSISHALNILE